MTRTALLALLLAWLAAGQALAQQVELQVDRGPHYVDVPIGIQVIASGFEEEPQPRTEVDPPAGGRLELLGVSPSVSSQITIINGRLSRTKDVRFVYRYRFLADHPGPVELGPFRVTQEGTTRSTRRLQLAVGEVPLSDRVRIELDLPDEPAYVGARIPVTLRWWLDDELARNLHDYRLKVPLFDATEAFQLMDHDDPQAKQEVKIETGRGTLRLRGTTEERQAGGRRYLVVSVSRTLVPLEPGRYRLRPATSVVEEGVSWRHDFFAGRQAARLRKLRAQDRERTLEIKPLPLENRPESFAGAIGKGFSLEVTADRTVVKTGDPILLTIRLQGEGNLESAGLGPLSADGGLSPERFRLPSDQATGVLEDGGKTFSRTVRVRDPSVREIPGIAYSFLDVETGGYRTVRSRPIALSVGKAEVIDATDVVTAEKPEGKTAQAAPREQPAQGTTTAPPGPIRLTGADLAIERNVTRLVRGHERSLARAWLWVGLHGAGLVLVLLALIGRRRASVDPGLVRRRRVLEEERRKILAAARRADRESVAEIAAALRRMRAETPAARSPELDAFLARCDTIRFAPAGHAPALDADFAQQARELSQALLGSGR